MDHFQNIPAFPETKSYRHLFGDEQTYKEPGMTLLDYFAGQALTGLIAQIDKAQLCSDFANQAYRVAQAMLKERQHWL